MKTININLPFFCGLYESPLYNSDMEIEECAEEANYYNSDYASQNHIELDLTGEDFELDFEPFKQAVADAFAKVWKQYAPDCVKSIKNASMWSPRYYNYDTDKVYADVELDDSWLYDMKHFIADNWEWFADRIESDWTSYDGFMSFMSTDVDEWLKKLDEEDPLYIECMIGYMAYKDNDGLKGWLIEDTWENICLVEFIKPTEEGQAKIDAAMEARPAGWDMTGQLEIEFKD